MVWAAVGAIGGALISGIASNSAANTQADAMKQAAQGANLQNWNYNGPGGMSANMGGQSYNPTQFTGFNDLANTGGIPNSMSAGYGGQGQGYGQPAPPRTGMTVNSGSGGGFSPTDQFGMPTTGQWNPTTMSNGPTGGGNGYSNTGPGNMTASGYSGLGLSPGGGNSPGGISPTYGGGASPGGGFSGQSGGMNAYAPAPYNQGAGDYFQQGNRANYGGSGRGGYTPNNSAGGSTGGGPNSLNTNLGNYLNPAFGGLGALGAGMVGQAGMAANGGIPGNIQQALGGLNYYTNNGPQGTQANLYGQSGGLAGMQMGQGMLAGQGMNQITGANANYQSAYNNALQSQMSFLNNQQGRAMQQSSDAQFGRGQMGTTGGGLQTQAMAQGFGLADAQAQQYAASQGLAAQGQALSSGNAMMSNAFGNYNNSANIQGNLYNNIFNQNGSMNNTMYNRAVQNVGTQTNMATLPQSIAGTDLNLATQAMQGASGLNTMGLQNAQAALGGSSAQANAAVRAGTVMGGIATNPSFTTGAQAWGNSLGNLVGNPNMPWNNINSTPNIQQTYGGNYTMPTNDQMLAPAPAIDLSGIPPPKL